MKKTNKLWLLPILAYAFPLITTAIIYIIYLNSFFEGAYLSETTAVSISLGVVLTGGILGTITGFFSLYIYIKKAKNWQIVIICLSLFPAMLLSTLITYAGLVLFGWL